MKNRFQEQERLIAFGKACFYRGFSRAINDDVNCFTAWREEAEKLIKEYADKKE